jgi:hypothetical protein
MSTYPERFILEISIIENCSSSLLNFSHINSSTSSTPVILFLSNHTALIPFLEKSWGVAHKCNEQHNTSPLTLFKSEPEKTNYHSSMSQPQYFFQ